MLSLHGLWQKTMVPERRYVTFWQIETSHSTTLGQVCKVRKSSCALRADADFFAEQLNSMDAGTENDDPVMKDVLNALIQHLD